MPDMLQRLLYTTQKPPLGSRIAPSTPWTSGLQGYWLFNEHGGASTRTLYRSSGDLVYNGTPEWTRGGAAVSGGSYLDATTPPAVGPLSLTMGVILRSSGFTRYAQWDSSGPVLYNFSGNLAIVFQNSFDYNPGTVSVATGIPAIIGLTVDGSTARVFCFQSGVFSYDETGSFGRSYAGFLGALRVGAGGLGGAVDASDAVFLWTAIHHRALSVTELRAISAQPYAVLEPPLSRLWQISPPAGGGPTSISLSGTQAQSGSVKRTVAHGLTGTQAQSGSLTHKATHLLSGTQAQAGSLKRTVTHPIAGTQAQAGTLAHTVTHLLSGSQAQTGSVTRTVAHPLAGTQAQSGSVVAIKAKIVVVAGTQAQSGSLTHPVSHRLVGTQPQTGTVIRLIPRGLIGTQPQVGSIAISTGGGVYTLAGTQAQVGNITILMVHYAPSPLPRTTRLGGSQTVARYAGSRLTTKAG